MRRASFPIVVGLVATALLHCGTKEHPAAFQDAPPGAFDAGRRGAEFIAADGGAVMNCGRSAEGGSCTCVEVPLLGEPSNLYFVLDRSASMRVEDKWTSMRIVVGKVMRAVGSRAKFGAAIFPGSVDTCSAGVEIMPTTLGDAFHSSTEDGPTTKLLLTKTAAISPFGGTPTAATLRDLEPILTNLSGKTFVILMTDGGPNCNANASCGISRCIANIENAPGCPPGNDGDEDAGVPNCCAGDEARVTCLDDATSVSAITHLRDLGIPTYVVGMPGSGLYANVLASFANAGGTALSGPPYYYAVDSTDQTAFLAAVKRVAANIVGTCEFSLSTPPDNPDDVNVYLDETTLPQSGADGWTIAGDKLTLLGRSCERVLSGDAVDVRILYGCPTLVAQ